MRRGVTTKLFSYSPFGEMTEGERDEAFTFTSLRNEDVGDEGELYSAQWRHLRPGLGRWVKRDPSGMPDGMNRYLYVRNNPYRYLDPTGLFIDKVAIAALVVLDGLMIADFIGSESITEAERAQRIAAISAFLGMGSAGPAPGTIATACLAAASDIAAFSKVAYSMGLPAAIGFASLPAGQRGIIAQSRAILSMPEFQKGLADARSGIISKVSAGNVTIQFEPGLSFSGFTDFLGNGFVIGGDALTSKSELVKTLFHELYRLSYTNLNSASGASATQTTQEAANFAETTFNAFKGLFQ